MVFVSAAAMATSLEIHGPRRPLRIALALTRTRCRPSQPTLNEICKLLQAHADFFGARRSAHGNQGSRTTILASVSVARPALSAA